MSSVHRVVLAAVSIAGAAQALSLSDVCTTTYARENLPAADFLPGITIDLSSVTTAVITNSTASNDWYITEALSYCSVTIAYSHNGIADDLVHVSLWVPEPDKFQNRYVTTGGSGLSINAGAVSSPTGVIVGAVSGYTDGGFGTFDSPWRAYIYYQPGAEFGDADTTYNSETGEWEVPITGLGGQWVAQFLQLQEVDNLSTLENVTYDTLKEWMIYGMQKYGDSLQTTEPDVSAFANAGGKVIHIHGEQDPSIPTASSIHYYESVRNVMFPNMTFDSSTEAMDEFYRLFLVPGGAHGGVSTEQPDGGWPATTLQTMIEWVENGIARATLNNTGTTASSLQMASAPAVVKQRHLFRLCL
ncbi:hypothetical protein BTUL_0024g00280 [Botrytis tulipae]|uniref:Carboxylic ester hydrolase n=1 Tax=Botrytis tulipae TaxID=87230 RepID=A0A4Z1EZQ9_9HELO|nr:hypothetical protein BTUL_0024g00280 [Botrytis tulipae]